MKIRKIVMGEKVPEQPEQNQQIPVSQEIQQPAVEESMLKASLREARSILSEMGELGTDFGNKIILLERLEAKARKLVDSWANWNPESPRLNEIRWAWQEVHEELTGNPYSEEDEAKWLKWEEYCNARGTTPHKDFGDIIA
jgi:hypothetical protein